MFTAIVLGMGGALVLALCVWGINKSKLGAIRCNRCGYSGAPKGAFAMGRGFVPVCRRCHSDNWVVVDSQN
jgi:ribosomal protein L40E